MSGESLADTQGRALWILLIEPIHNIYCFILQILDAKVEGYTGLIFFYHNITNQIIVEWVANNINDRVKSETEKLLRDICKGKIFFLFW